ncbi:MAG: 50S ribosomal protein L6 [Pirellulaceae bacterium]
MSRIGKQPIAVLDGVKVAINGRTITAEGPRGKLELEHRPEISLEYDDEKRLIHVKRATDDRIARALHGLTRSLVNNMVTGVKEGYEKRLEIVGVGYGGTVQGNQLQLRVGFANEIKKIIPQGLDVTCPDQNHVVIKGCDKQKVGQFAAEVRAVRKPEPYKGKGIRYDGEYVKIKPGKTAT